jgi:hypothetical protein
VATEQAVKVGADLVSLTLAESVALGTSCLEEVGTLLCVTCVGSFVSGSVLCVCARNEAPKRSKAIIKQTRHQPWSSIKIDARDRPPPCQESVLIQGMLGSYGLALRELRGETAPQTFMATTKLESRAKSAIKPHPHA